MFAHSGKSNEPDTTVDPSTQHRKIEGTDDGAGLSAGKALALPRPARRVKIEPPTPLSITRQCAPPALSCASYVRSRAPGPDNAGTALNEASTSIYERHPYVNSRRMQLALRNTGRHLGILRIQPLIRELGLVPRAHHRCIESGVGGRHYLHPHASRSRLRGGHHGRAQPPRPARPLSNTIDTRFCVDASQDALDCYRKPDILNTDQGSQLTGTEFLQVLRGRDAEIRMDGQGLRVS